jgi:hypothetical protein
MELSLNKWKIKFSIAISNYLDALKTSNEKIINEKRELLENIISDVDHLQHSYDYTVCEIQEFEDHIDKIKMLHGIKYQHACYEFDEMPINEYDREFRVCRCYPKSHNWTCISAVPRDGYYIGRFVDIFGDAHYRVVEVKNGQFDNKAIEHYAYIPGD